MTMNDLKEYAQFNKDFLADVQAAKKAGKSVDDVANSWKMPAKYAGKQRTTRAASALRSTLGKTENSSGAAM